MSENHYVSATSTTGTRRWGQQQRIDNLGKGKARIIEAARLCFAESGVASTTIDQIAERAAISRRTVYHYFDNKKAIIHAVVEQQVEPFFEQFKESLQALPNKDFRELLIHCVLFSVEKGPQMAGHHLLLGSNNIAATADFYIKSASMRENMYVLLEGQFQQAQLTGEIDPAWRLNDLVNWVGRLIYSFIQYPEPRENIERMVTRYLLPDLTTR